jgi:HK97 family phage major capsid protein
MPEITKPQEVTAKRARLAACAKEMHALVENENGSPRESTPEEIQRFDALATEAKTIKAELAAVRKHDHRLEVLADVEKALNSPVDIPIRLDSPEAQMDQALLDLKRGSYSLRNFKPEGMGVPKAKETAYKQGLCLIATCGNGASRDWALKKLGDAGLSVQKLSPFQAEDGGTSGGYLVFPEFEATLINLKEQYGVFQREAFKLPMGSDTLVIPRRAGGTTVYYPGENAQITESAMKFDQVQLVAKKYAQMTRWSTELNEDSVIAMADLLAGEFAYQFAKAEDDNGFNGTGTSSYAGTVGLVFKLITSVNGVSPSASVVSGIATHTDITKLTLADWSKVVGTLPIYAEGRAAWYMSKSAFWAGPAALIEAAGGNIAMYLSSGVPLMWLGYRVVPTQAMTAASALTTTATAVTSVPAVFGDMLATAYMGTRRGVTVRLSDQRYIEYDQIAIQCTQRVAVNNVVGDSVAPTTVPGPMLALQIPSA